MFENYRLRRFKRKKTHKLKRQVYVSQGPNFMWHIDGYDKLKPFSLPIHGAIDGFTKKILWLNICPSNKGPQVISYFYVNCISNLKCVSKRIRGYRGSENVVLAGMQGYFTEEHKDSMSGHSSFLLGNSTNNQRIESWWLFSKRQNNARWINFFKDLQDEGLFDPSLNHHKEFMKFCFSGILPKELDNIKEMWNIHCIRNSRNAECPGGRPDVLNFNPAAAGAIDYKFPLAGEKLNQALRFCVYPSLANCTEDFLSLVSLIMTKENLRAPKNIDKAKSLFLRLFTVRDSL